MKRGEYYDTDSKLFLVVFSMLVDFVENEVAHLSKISVKTGGEYMDFTTGRTRSISWLKASSRNEDTHPTIMAYQNASWWDRWRNSEAWNEKLALAHWDWEMTLADPKTDEWGNDISHPSQAAAAKEVRELYLWYKHVYPNRPDSHDLFPDVDDYEKYFEVVAKYRDEDDKMLCRVIRARHGMWT
jgi:hypothetical protein